MPELPEVETVCNALKNRAESRIIKEFKIYNPNLRWVITVSYTHLTLPTIYSV